MKYKDAYLIKFTEKEKDLLKLFKIKINSYLQNSKEIMNFQESLHIVGGFLRDKIMGKVDYNDIDFVLDTSIFNKIRNYFYENQEELGLEKFNYLTMKFEQLRNVQLMTFKY